MITIRLTGAQGESEGFVGVTHDISQRKQFEQRLEVQNQELRRINQELDNFVYRVSHDLRALLCSAMGLTELMQALDSAEDIKSYLVFQRKTFEKLDNFIREILDYSRNSRVEVSLEQIDVAALFEELLAPAYAQAARQNVRLEVEIAVSYIIADALRLSIILNNVVSNAIKFTRPLAGPWVRIMVSQMGHSIAISVSDNGTGIYPERTDRLFQMFDRATDEHYGSGLGLYIARQAAQAMGGELTVNTVWNQGSTFTLLLPQPPVHQPVFSAETQVSTLQTSVPISGE